MNENKKSNIGADILNAYTTPFTRGGFMPFFGAFAFSLVPFMQAMILSLTSWDAESLINRGLKRAFVTALKMLAATMLILAPTLSIYLIYQVFEDIFKIKSPWILYTLGIIMLYLGVSALIRLPMALAALARDRSIKEATCGHFVKLLISASFSRYLLSLLGLAPFAALTIFMNLMPLSLSYIYGALITAWILTYLGYTISRSYDWAAFNLGLTDKPPLPPKGQKGLNYSFQGVISLILVIVILLQPASALAFNEDEMLAEGRYPKHQYTAAEYDGARDKFIKSGELNRYTVMNYDTSTGRFYCTRRTVPGDTVAELVVDFVADSLPVISTVKNLYEANQYRKMANDPAYSAKERANARNMQHFKLLMAGLSVAGPLGKATSMVTGKGVIPFLIARAGKSVSDPAMLTIIGGVNKYVWGWGRVRNVSMLAGGQVREALEPYTLEVGMGVETPYDYGVHDPINPTRPETSPQSPQNAKGDQSKKPGDGADKQGEIVLPDLNLDPSLLMGSYRGKLINIDDISVQGALKADFSEPILTLNLAKDGILSFNYTYEGKFEFAMEGVSQSGSLTLPVSVANIKMERTENGYFAEGSSNTPFTATQIIKYSGKGYAIGEDGIAGGEVKIDTENEISWEIDISFVDTEEGVVPYACGLITQTPIASDEYGGGYPIVMTFDLTQAK